MLLKPKYGRFRNESVTSSDDLMQSLAMSGKVVATPVVPSSTPSLPLPPLPPLDPSARSSSSAGATALADSPCMDGEQDATTTFCMLIPKMPQWKFSNSLLSRSPSNSSSSSSSSKDSGKAAAAPSHSSSSSSHMPSGVISASGPVASLAAVLNSCDPVCVTPCSLQAIRGQRAVANSASPGGHGFGATEAMASPGGSSSSRSGMNRRTRVEGMWLGGEDFNQKGSFIHKPSQGWLHPDKKIAGPGASYIVRYMGCIEVLKSMRSLDFNTRTQVTREAINRLCDAVPGGKGAWRKKALNKALQSIMGKSNLRFAGMSIAVNISIDGLCLLIPTTRQVIAHHPMQSISFASGGDTDTPDYVAYVAKDPVNQRACHILECSDGLAQSVISTIGQAFELQFKQYLHSPPKTMASMERSVRTEEPMWGEDEDFSEHDYYNSIPGKEPPVGGVVDSRLRPSGALLGHIHTQPQNKTAAQMGSLVRREQASYPPGQLCYELHWDTETNSNSGLTSDGYLCADGQPPRDYEEHQYVNTQSLENLDSLAQGPDGHRGSRAPDSPKKDLFDMRTRQEKHLRSNFIQKKHSFAATWPFEDALKLHEASSGAAAGGCRAQAGGGGVQVLEDQWPSPPRRRAPVAPNEEQLRRETWYHSRMSRRDAEKLLVRDGDFLVRESTTNPGQYVLTGMHCGLPKHLLLVDPEGVVRTKDMLFESISHLISYHLKNELPIVAAESELHLKQVVRRKQ
ncbi:SHC-transforming protein 2 isoform X1 [Thunnus maccoyii]|uniref:SHC-transforming protein 2 isoform X1 n=1 Tax=Thunnus maccoyii TaxID=8240 RepID=UPI001C4B59A1|nr:SHC-transforming protein 2 isoform X1 [Thunnus maccoyii]XP_042273250.1 SHC-transforming protein 2 isoform X1 [Thunnus maccoyii]XP_042273252.1 SHC-transforming protein 2 isoform X1 [Thunnus maccoyii]XP_042273253.1 SHC-transforming protein 2 isoform X1 [Thunnus maccoyii]